MRRRKLISILCAATALLAVCAIGASALAQSGSTGGAIGKQGKSVSGGEPEPPPPVSAKPHSTKRKEATGETKGTSCGHFTGIWNSWATGIFGSGDVTVFSDGTAVHRSGIRGKWTCQNGIVLIKWGEGELEHHTMSRDGKRLTKDDGVVYFWRVGAPRYSAADH